MTDHVRGAFQLKLEEAGDGASASGEKSRNGARVAFATRCEADEVYDPSEYQAEKLLGKTLSWTVDLSAAECGCNVALYLVSMHQSTSAGWCFEPGAPQGGDYYCDANSGITCGTACTEIDLVEGRPSLFPFLCLF